MKKNFIDKLAFIEVQNKKVLVTLSREKFDFFSYSQKELISTVDHLIFDDLRNEDLIE